MPISQFPTITTGKWITEGLEFGPAADAVLETVLAAGYTQTATRANWVPGLFVRRLVGLTLAEAQSIETHFAGRDYGALPFWWHNTLKGIDKMYYVKYHISSRPVRFKPFAGRTDIFETVKPLAFVQRTDAELEPGSLIFGDIDMLAYKVENLAPGSDITTRPIWGTQNGFDLSDLSIITEGAPAGVDNSNTVVITLKNGAGSTIVTKTYNTASQPPTSDTASLGALSITTIAASDIITLTVTCGTTANMPAFSILAE